MQVAILAHEQFPDRAKTAVGILRYGDHDVVGILDRTRAGAHVSDFLDDVQDAPIVERMEEIPDCDALIIGVAPIGGGFEESWRADVRTALVRGCTVIAGLHYLLSEDAEFRQLAADHGGEIRDIRQPPEDLPVAAVTANEVDAHVVLTVGTDCSSGKMTSAFELRDTARNRGLDACVVPTGQTGIMIAGWGIAIDRVIADFAAGAAEQLVERAGDHDLIVVEGQGALAHPAYSGVTTAILHGTQPDALALCHVAGREQVSGYESFQLPPPAAYARLYEQLAEPVSAATVDAGLLNTQGLNQKRAADAVAEYEDELGVPVTDPVRNDCQAVLEAVCPDQLQG